MRKFVFLFVLLLLAVSCWAADAPKAVTPLPVSAQKDVQLVEKDMTILQQRFQLMQAEMQRQFADLQKQHAELLDKAMKELKLDPTKFVYDEQAAGFVPKPDPNGARQDLIAPAKK